MKIADEVLSRNAEAFRVFTCAASAAIITFIKF